VDLDPKPVFPESGFYPEQNLNKKITIGKYSDSKIKIATNLIFWRPFCQPLGSGSSTTMHQRLISNVQGGDAGLGSSRS
jgi:hypothetical protein